MLALSRNQVKEYHVLCTSSITAIVALIPDRLLRRLLAFNENLVTAGCQRRPITVKHQT